MIKFKIKPRLPILKLEYFFFIAIAIISVPPVEPLLENTRPYPIPQRTPPYIQYKRGSFKLTRCLKLAVTTRNKDKDSDPIIE